MLNVIGDLAASRTLPLNSPDLMRSAIKTMRMLFLRGLTTSIFGLKTVMSNNMDNVKETTNRIPPLTLLSNVVLDSTMVGLNAAYLVNLLNISRHNTILCGVFTEGDNKNKVDHKLLRNFHDKAL